MVAMRNAGGYVRVYRSLLDWEWYDDDACVRLMLHLMLSVNWEPKEWHGQTIQPGQLVTSMDKLAGKLRLSRSAVRRALDKLKSTGEVTVQTNNHWTTVTLGNWGEYQEFQPTAGRPSRQQATDRRPTADRPAATTKEGKALEEGKQERNEKSAGALVFPVWSTDRFREAWETWKLYKAEKGDRYKPIGEQAALSKLGADFSSEPACLAAIEHSMGQGYKGIFPARAERAKPELTADRTQDLKTTW